MKPQTLQTECWVCHAPLAVRFGRHAGRRFREGDGYNTIDPNKRVCDECWEQIERRSVASMQFANGNGRKR